MKKLFYLFLVSGLLFSCDSTEKTSGEETEVEVEETSSDSRSTTTNPLFNDLMVPTADGVFRGTSFNMSRSEVYEIETSRSTVSIYKDDTEDELIITTDMGKEILDFGDVTYRFDEQGLYSIKVETYATSLEVATEVFDLIIEKYTAAYGEPTIAEDGYYEFTATDAASKLDYSISVKNIDDVEESFGMYMYFDLL